MNVCNLYIHVIISVIEASIILWWYYKVYLSMLQPALQIHQPTSRVVHPYVCTCVRKMHTVPQSTVGVCVLPVHTNPLLVSAVQGYTLAVLCRKGNS